MNRQEIKSYLEQLGYEVSLANMDCYDIDQNGRIHYLSSSEVQNLLNSNLEHPISLAQYSNWGGLNYWYSFP